MSYSSHSRRYTESSYQEHLKNLYKIISRDSDLTRFSARIDETDPLIKCILKLDDPLTVFAPTNKSFEKPIQICDTIEEAIKYHTIPRYLPPNKLCNNKLYNTLADRRQARITSRIYIINRIVITIRKQIMPNSLTLCEFKHA